MKVLTGIVLLLNDGEKGNDVEFFNELEKAIEYGRLQDSLHKVDSDMNLFIYKQDTLTAPSITNTFMPTSQQSLIPTFGPPTGTSTTELPTINTMDPTFQQPFPPFHSISSPPMPLSTEHPSTLVSHDPLSVATPEPTIVHIMSSHPTTPKTVRPTP